jgi:hypothetical protein
VTESVVVSYQPAHIGAAHTAGHRPGGVSVGNRAAAVGPNQRAHITCSRSAAAEQPNILDDGRGPDIAEQADVACGREIDREIADCMALAVEDAVERGLRIPDRSKVLNAGCVDVRSKRISAGPYGFLVDALADVLQVSDRVDEHVGRQLTWLSLVRT